MGCLNGHYPSGDTGLSPLILSVKKRRVTRLSNSPLIGLIIWILPESVMLQLVLPQLLPAALPRGLRHG